MYSFYLFEGSFWQGGAGWETVHIGVTAEEMRQAVRRYLLDVHWGVPMRGEICAIEIYQSARGAGSIDVYPRVGLKYPGLTEIRFAADGTRIGGAGEPGGPYAGMAQDQLWNETQLVAELYELGQRDSDAVVVNTDDLVLPALTEPLLDAGTAVILSDSQGNARFVPADADEEDEEDEELLFYGANDLD